MTVDEEEVLAGTLETHEYPEPGDEVLVKVESVMYPTSFFISLPHGVKTISSLTEDERTLEQTRDQWSSMEESMQSLYSSSRRHILHSLPAPGSLVACLDSGRWKRAMFLENNLGLVYSEVHLLDQGTQRSVLTRNIRALDQSHALLPARVMEACIADVEPPGDQGWTRDAAQLMISLCSSSKYLKAKVVGRNDKLVINLIAIYDDEEVDIGIKLVENNFACHEV